MSKYTTEVRFICENVSGLTESVGYGKVAEIIQSAIPKIFDFDFPIFDESYRNVIESKILMHYYTREIGEETVGLWKLRLCTRLNEIMPYYNKLYESELLEFNPLYDVDITRTHTIKNNGTTNDNGRVEETKTISGNGEDKSDNKTTTTTTTNNTDSGESNRRDLYADTPQGAITNLENETYLTNARKILDSNSRNNTENSNGSGTNVTTNTNKYNESIGTMNTKENATTMQSTEEYLESVKGKQGSKSYTKMLIEYRDTFLNIDMMVINELSDLFIGLW